jgi:murein L,D-transpeptidase YcbB/YkuD
MVNIPAFRLDAYDRMDQPDSSRLRINVVVGTAYKTQTPVLTAALTSVDFMPDWDVPPSIAVNEVLPEALKDSTYLRKNHFDLLRGGALVRPTPAAIGALGHGTRVRQQPGPDNPLGRIKFVMPNRYDIYLHDTPVKYLFDRRQRDFSHGCIRVGNAPALARWVLRERPDWPAARIDSALAGVTTLKVRLPRPMLVAIVYATAEAREDGTVRFYPDVYGHDRALELLLAGAPYDSVAAERLRGFEARHGSPAPAAPAPPTATTTPPIH